MPIASLPPSSRWFPQPRIRPRTTRSFLRFALALTLISFFPAQAWAHHLHYVPITDTRYAPNTLFDLFGEPPLYEWVTFTGDDTFSTFSADSTVVTISSPVGLAENVFDAPVFEDITDAAVTAFFEFEITDLDNSPGNIQTIEVGLIDIATKVKWDEAAGNISGTRSGLEDLDVENIPRWSELGDFPLRLQIYYNFSDWIVTFVIINDASGASSQASWAATGVVNPFQNFFGQVPGTDPDNLDIYSFVICEAACAVTILDTDRLSCDTVDGEVDVASCRPTDLMITNDDGHTSVVPGQPLTYEITASNLGPWDAAMVSVTDHFPAGLTCSWTCVGSGGASCTAGPVAGDISDFPSLPVGSVAAYSAACTVDPTAGGALINTATISGVNADPTLANNSATDVDLVVAGPDLGITNSDGQSAAVPGGWVSYVMTAINFGPTDVFDATVSDSFPTTLDCDWICFESGGASCTAFGSGDIAESVDLPEGATTTFLATCDVDPGATGTLVNVASILPPDGIEDPVAANDSAVDSDLLTPRADLMITKDDGTAVALPGDEVTYTIVAGNGGPSDAPASAVEDLLPPELVDCSWICSSSPGAVCTGGPVLGDLIDSVDLPAGSQVTYTVDCTVDPTADFHSFSNTATITTAAGVTEIDPGDNAATDTDVSSLLTIFLDGFESGDTTAWSGTSIP